MSDPRGEKFDLCFAQGKTYSATLAIGGKPYVYKAISAITQAAPARLTVTGHGLPDPWSVAVVSVKGMRQINAQNSPPRPEEYETATVIDANTIEFNEVNASDFSPYTSGGSIQFYTPTDLTGVIVRLTIRDRIGGISLLALDSAGLGGIAIDTATHTITFTVTDEQTAAFAWANAIYDSEIEFPGGTVKPLTYGAATVKRESTT